MPIVQPRIGIAVATAVFAIAALVGCSAPSPDAPADPGTSAPAEETSSAPTLATADSSLGQIVVGADGMTVYVFDNDTEGATSSACVDACAATWPAVHGDDTTVLDGVTGELGTITGTDGEPQATLNGWPLYYYAPDSRAGDVTGQAFGGIWWVVAPDGTKITAAPAPESPAQPYSY